jgi:hypothetical protein
MPSPTNHIQCGEHGLQDKTFVCQHVLMSLRDGIQRGFFWSQNPDSSRPDAWCRDCNERVGATGGEWTAEAEALAGVTLLCGACYDRVKAMNGI